MTRIMKRKLLGDTGSKILSETSSESSASLLLRWADQLSEESRLLFFNYLNEGE